MKKHFYYFTFVLWLLSYRCSAQTPPSDVRDSIQVRLNAVCTANSTIKGGILKVDKVGEWTGIWTYGVRDTVANVPLTGMEYVRVGSVSKNFLATAILKLASSNVISLNDTIGLYLPSYITSVIPYHSSITIRHLLRHTSGLADPVNDPSSTLPTDILANPFLTRQFDTLMLHYFAPLRPISAPGDTAHYSNTNYWILGKVVESVTGMSYDSYIDSVIINPLGLANTYIPSLGDSSILTPYLHGYTNIGGVSTIDASFENMSWAFSAGSVISNIDDISSYYKALRSGVIIPGNWVDSMSNCTVSTPATTSPYKQHFGLGIFDVVNTSDAIHFIGHNGEVPGYSSIMYYYPQHNAYITATVGADPADYVDILAILIDQYLDQLPSQVDRTNELSNRTMLSPTPCRDGFFVKSQTMFDKVRIYDLQGQIKQEIPFQKGEMISTSGLVNGSYIVELISCNSVFNERLLITVLK